MSTKPFAFNASPSSCKTALTGRVLPLDGLRGLLALGVFVNHAAIYRTYPATGVWRTNSAFCSMLGQLGVSLFFMITAYLFYGRLIAERGRPDWRRLYIGRLFRIAPVYLLAVGGLFATVAISDFRLKVSGGALVAEIAAWLALGAGPRVDLNAFSDTRHVLAGVTWTLQSEWLFYATLPLLALVARRSAATALLVPAIGFVLLLGFLSIARPADFPACVAPFLAGMSCAVLQRQRLLPPWLASMLVTGIAVVLASAVLDPRMPVGLLLQAGAFYLMVSGCQVFGLLTSRTCRWLGGLSYPVYLLHGLLLAWFFAIPACRAFAEASSVQHWLSMLLVAGLLLAVAQLVHRLVEEPGIRLGRRVARIGQAAGPASSRPAGSEGALAEHGFLALRSDSL